MLELRDICKEYDGKPLLDKVGFHVKEAETVCLLGPSGSGKSTILRMIAGIESPDSGEISWNGYSILGVPIHQRRFGLVFQDYALFPHLNVFDNAAFGLRMQNADPDLIQIEVKKALEMVGMESFAMRQVDDLSGGEQQRLALARTIAAKPQLLLLDEPLAALDRVLRKQLLTEIRHILHSTRIPAIYVTHDQEEAYQIADQVLLLGKGSILQSGSPMEIYNHPVNLEAARFLGLRNILCGELVRKGATCLVSTEIGEFECLSESAEIAGLTQGDRVHLLIRGVEVVEETSGTCNNRFTARVLDAFFQEDHTLVIMQAGSCTFEFSLPVFPDQLDQVELCIPMDKIQLFPGEPCHE